ncbi:brain tumor protein [Aphis gossypii]|uniref:Brain tumor protein n=2 Tax=Aphis TaxID=464929 RepID=A0A9P0NED4_APHGO|nr:brain tumor protein [Aphis gossypii]XP_027845819.2 brain tumor protein [Aphis gossypii]XP_027845820.2 brain tumor protein [Aphis gossypii]XP_027845821.2 brain tumor protein [Aphis gossypii]KAF0768631.1 brain tumor protein [Aphis craccivora]CAH1722463.1 unnamed protein product [Aphis gossypii]
MMASPTPSLDSLSGFNTFGPDYNRSLSSSHSPTDSDSSGSGVSTGGSGTSNNTGPRKCQLCHEIFSNPRVLPCLHTFCHACLENNQDQPEKITCPNCHQECILTNRGISGLLPDFTVNGSIEVNPDKFAGVCKGCKNLNTNVVAYCYDCQQTLCANCMMAHQFMNCFEDHRLHGLTFENGDDTKNAFIPTTVGDRVVFCSRHKNESLKYFCRTCNVPVCKECTLSDHQFSMHDVEHLSDIGVKLLDILNGTVQESKVKATDIRNMVKNIEHTSNKLQVQYHKAQNEINETFAFYRSMLEERKQELLKEVESVYSAKQLTLNEASQKGLEVVDKIYQTGEFVDRLTKNANVVECLLFKKLLDSKLQSLMSYEPDNSVQNICDLEFVSNYQAIQVGVRNTFGYVRSSTELGVIGPGKQPPIARPTNGSLMNGNSTIISNGCMNGGGPADLMQQHNGVNCTNGGGGNGGIIERPYSNGLTSTSPLSSGQYDTNNILSKRFNSVNSLGPFSASSIGDLNLNAIGNMNGINGMGGGNGGNGGNGVNGGGMNSINPYEKWSNGGSGDIFQNGSADFPLTIDNNDSILDLSSKLFTASIFPPKSQIKRHKMIYHCKFGEFGAMEGQFTEPSGVAVNAQNDIIVADTNNHRIQIFDKEGRFKFQFGECGKRDGQLLYPNRVAVVKPSGDIIVTERSPTHQIQIYNQYGQFVRKFGANILQHPRGITVDNKGRIVVVECKVMRVIIFDQAGNVLVKFGCSKHLEFPNGVVVNDKQEIFISDNRAHCVKVFNYEGQYLRQIGSQGITNYPIGVGINASGEILIADNHNNFNLTIFTQEGQLVSALESKVKHAQCFDVALMDDGSVVLASKDYRLYIYRYIQIPPMLM